MPNPSIGKEEGERRIALVEQALRDGFAPRGVSGGKSRGAVRAAAASEGVPAGSVTGWLDSAIKAAGRAPDWSLWEKPDPEGRGLFNGGAPDGYMVKGRSTYYGPDGQIGGEWVKTSVDAERQEAMLREALAGMADKLPRAKPTKGPKKAAPDLLACYVVSDHHFGMLAWGEETGDEDYNLEIAEGLLTGALDHLVNVTEPCEQALIVFLGDLFHYDSFDSLTPQSRNLLDSDTRYPKMVRAAVRSARQLIRSALAHHTSVNIIVERGNHDPASSIFLMEALQNVYENEPRVSIDTSPQKFHYHRFGKNLVGVHHGDTVKSKDLPLVMAHDRARDWGETEHRFWWTGHVHHDATQEYPGVKCESFRVLASKDAWHSEKGYRSARDMKAIVLHKTYGEVARHTFNPEMLSADA